VPGSLEDEPVLEIGPGPGGLTRALLRAGARVTAIEMDRRCLPALAELAEAFPGRLRVIAGDALKIDPATLFDAPYAIVANLPYNVGVPVLLHLLAELPGIRRGLVMVQAEVADRLAAAPGSKTYGVPSAKLAWFAEARRAGPVPRTVFWPVPNVDSGLLSFTCRPAPSGAARSEVFAVVDAAFAQRRKALRSALAGWAGSPAAAEVALRAAGIDPLTRAERLGIADFARLAAARPA
jgi:16S rRNA (adenine1518-N6/adenine1519-N6)-dimethyltransferase